MPVLSKENDRPGLYFRGGHPLFLLQVELVQSVLYSVFYLGSLAVVESVECAYEISRDPSDPLEAYAFTYLTVYILYYFVIHTNTSHLFF